MKANFRQGIMSSRSSGANTNSVGWPDVNHSIDEFIDYFIHGLINQFKNQ